MKRIGVYGRRRTEEGGERGRGGCGERREWSKKKGGVRERSHG